MSSRLKISNVGAGLSQSVSSLDKTTIQSSQIGQEAIEPKAVPSAQNNNTFATQDLEAKIHAALTTPDRSITSEPSVSIPATTTPLGILVGNRSELVLQHNQVMRDIEKVVKVFPEKSQEGIRKALQTSVNRVLEAHSEERLSMEEAGAAIEMMREMVEALHDLRTGQAKVLRAEDHGDNVRVWHVQTTDGDEVVVSTRNYLDEKGEARFSIRHITDDGISLPGRYRMSMRLDLERWGNPSVDVQFGTSGLNQRIHGLYRNEDGSIFRTDSGGKLPDHHFRDDLPSTLRDPEIFANMVRSFANNVMEPLPVIGQ
jgi:hypothetical protein